MELKYQLKLQKNLDRIASDLIVSDVKCFLIQEGVISFEDCAHIEGVVSKKDQASKLIEMIMKGGPKAYGIFRDSLRELYEHLVTTLDDTKVTANELADWGYSDAIRRNIVELSNTLKYEDVSVRLLAKNLIEIRQLQDWDAMSLGPISKMEMVLKEILRDKTKSKEFIQLLDLEDLLKMEVAGNATEVKSTGKCNSSSEINQNAEDTVQSATVMARKPTICTYVPPNLENEVEYEMCKEAEVIQRNTEKLIPLMDPCLIGPFLQCLTSDDLKSIATKKSTEGSCRATDVLLDRLVRKKNFWDDLICALKNKAIRLGDTAEELEKDMELYIEEKKKKDMNAEMTESPMDCENIDDGEPTAKVRKLQEEPSTSKPSEAAQQSNSSATLVYSKELIAQANNFPKKTIERLELPESTMTPRGYQEALADLAKKGHNTIICAPTGSGKTFVASMICGNHLQKMYAKTKPNRNENEKKMVEEVIEERKDVKIVIIVPRHAILLQWYRELKKIFPTYKIAKRSGSEQQTNVPIDIKIKVHDVVILTAELFKNALVDDKIIDLSTVTLLVFDECHHTMEDHPYNMIMAEYRRVKLPNPNTKLPQIVGLSASPGAGRKTTYDNAENRILNLCANLDAEFVVTVPKELQEELDKYTPKSTLKKRTTGARINNPFTKQLTTTMASIESFAGMQKIHEHERGRPEYRAKIEKELAHAREEDNECKRKCGEYLLEYNTALELIGFVQLKEGLKLLHKSYNMLKKRKAVDKTEEYLLKSFTDVAEQLQQYSENEHLYPNPMLQNLKSGIVEKIEECKQRNDELRGIIFVPTKLLAEALRDFLSEDPELSHTNPMFFISSNRSIEAGRMTKSDQDATLENFKDGKVKLLISTSILDEGANIEGCNMTVNYGRLTNAITMLQSRGRARKENSTDLLIGNEAVVEKNEVNLILIEQMDKAIANIQQSQKDNKHSYQTKLAVIQQKDVSSRETKMQETTLLQNSNSAEVVEFRCKVCKLIVCKASDMRVIDGSFVNPCPEFREKVKFCEHTDPAWKQQGKQEIFCAKCDSPWGNTADGHPCLRMKSFIILVKGKVKKVRKWKEMPCKIQPYDGCTYIDT